jgi:hypothetical protein
MYKGILASSQNSECNELRITYATLSTHVCFGLQSLWVRWSLLYFKLRSTVSL